MDENGYTRQNRTRPSQSTMNALSRSKSVDGRSVCDAKNRSTAPNWHEAMGIEKRALKQLNFLEEIDRPTKTKGLHTNFVMKRNRNEHCTKDKNLAKRVVCGNEEQEKENDRLLPVVDYTMINHLLFLAVQNGLVVCHIDFQNAFPIRKLDRIVYAELPSYIYEELVRWDTV